jgi:hypothetical protein
MAFFDRGVAYGQVNDSQRAIDDYTAVVGLDGAPTGQVARALYYRGVTFFKENKKQLAQSDFEALNELPGTPVKEFVHSHLALSELHFSEGKWSEGFLTLKDGLERGMKAEPSYQAPATDLIGIVFSAGLSPEGRQEKVAGLLHCYEEHRALSVLGEAVVQHLGRVFCAGEPYPSEDNLEGWILAWEQAAEGVSDFRLSLRLLRTAVDFVKAGGKDPGVLLTLTSPERAILEQAFGLVEENGSKGN